MPNTSRIAIIGTVASSIVGFRKPLIEKLISQNHKVFAFAIDYDSNTEAQVLRLGAIPVSYHMDRGGVNPISDLINMVKLARKLKRFDIDIVFSYFSKPVIYGTIAAKLANIRCRIGMLEGLGYAFTERPNGKTYRAAILKSIQIFLYRLSLPLLSQVIFLNPDDLKDLLIKHQIHTQNHHVLGGIGVNLREFRYSPPLITPITFLFIGRFLAEKGVNEFIAAARHLKINYPSARFVMLGQPDNDNPGALSETSLQTLVDNEVIICPGQVTDVRTWLDDSSVFVLPSYREGVPRSTQEALAVGRPVITTDAPGCRETVIDGVNGFLVKPGSVDELLDRMIYFLTNPDHIIKMGTASRRLAIEKFDENAVSQRLVNLICNISDFNE